MADTEKIKEELRQEIDALERELEEKRLSCKPVMIPGFGKNTEHFTYDLKPEMDALEKEIERKKNLLQTYELNLIGKHKTLPPFDKEAHLLPEYRTGGYFTSQDFYDKCDEFHRTLEEQGKDFMSLRRDEYIFLKKKFLQDKYGITWLSEEYQFLPGTVMDVHISHPGNH